MTYRPEPETSVYNAAYLEALDLKCAIIQLLQEYTPHEILEALADQLYDYGEAEIRQQLQHAISSLQLHFFGTASQIEELVENRKHDEHFIENVAKPTAALRELAEQLRKLYRRLEN